MWSVILIPGINHLTLSDSLFPLYQCIHRGYSQWQQQKDNLCEPCHAKTGLKIFVMASMISYYNLNFLSVCLVVCLSGISSVSFWRICTKSHTDYFPLSDCQVIDQTPNPWELFIGCVHYLVHNTCFGMTMTEITNLKTCFSMTLLMLLLCVIDRPSVPWCKQVENYLQYLLIHSSIVYLYSLCPEIKLNISWSICMFFLPMWL